MDKISPYYRQTTLLVRVLPHVANGPCFVLKGGTAIDLFTHDFLQLSADIDLAYILLESKEVTLPNMQKAFIRIATELRTQTGLGIMLQTNNPDEIRIIVTIDDAQIKVEVSPVTRGTLYPLQKRDVVEVMEEEFDFVAIPVVSLSDLYSDELCTALDRQHPRNFYDIKMLPDTQGIDRAISNGFIAHLLSHNRPLSEVFNSHQKDITEPLQSKFSGTTFEEVSLEELREVPERVLGALEVHPTQQDFGFLRLFKRGEPNWNLAPEPHAQSLPAVQWRLHNISRMSEEKRMQSLEKPGKVMTEWLGQSIKFSIITPIVKLYYLL